MLNTINCEALFEGSVCAKIRALDVYDQKILVGTFGSEIYQLETGTQIKNVDEGAKFRVLSKNMSGHYSPNYVTNEVWGLGFLD